MIIKPEEFKKEQPKASVILPVFNGEQSPHYSRLLKELRKQTFQDFEMIVSTGCSPNGRARNEGVAQAKGDFLFFIDETVYLTGEKIFENMLVPFESSSNIGIVGASCEAFPGISWIQRQYFSSRSFHIPMVEKPYLGARVQHACMVIPRKIYQKVGWESDRLITGTDNDLRIRVARSGYDAVLVPEALVYYEPPKSFFRMLEKSYQKGRGSAFAFMIYPGLFELSERFKIRQPILGVIYKIASTLRKFVSLRFLLSPVVLCCEVFICLGFISGYFQWFGQKQDLLRRDLRWSS